MKKQWENPSVNGRGQYIVGVKALPNVYAFVGSDIFPQLPSLYGILQNKGYLLTFQGFGGKDLSCPKSIVNSQ